MTVYVIDEFDKLLEDIERKLTIMEEALVSSDTIIKSNDTFQESVSKRNTERDKVNAFFNKLYYNTIPYILIGNNHKYCVSKIESYKSREFAKGFFRAGRFRPIDFTLKPIYYSDICDFYMPTLTKKQKETLLTYFLKTDNTTPSYICDVARSLGYSTCFKIPYIKAKDFNFTPTENDFEDVVQNLANEDTSLDFEENNN